MEEVQVLEMVFAQVEDPRIERTKQRRLRDILIIAICGVICGAEGWVGINVLIRVGSKSTCQNT